MEGKAHTSHKILSVSETKDFLDKNPRGYMIDVLPEEQYARQHIPGSKPACVFETAFLEKMCQLVPQKDAPVLLYGAGSSHDSAAAAHKLQEAGYTDVSVFPGGVDAWREAGYPLEGSAPNVVDEPYPSQVPAYRHYRLVPEKSRLAWVGRGDANQHWGSVGFKSGSLTFTGDNGIGAITVDMTRIKCDDLADEGERQELIRHLSSDDFFLTRLFPEVHLEIADLYPKEGIDDIMPGMSEALPNYWGRAAAKIRKHLKFLEGELSLRNLPEGGLALSGQMAMDRTDWGIIYGSARFFRYLGIHKLDDLISLDAMMIFEPADEEPNLK